jgi:DNA-directed RNA polymerase subunit N (RpoN/RPB10)
MLFMCCPSCGSLLAHIQPVWEDYKERIKALPIPSKQKTKRYSELARMLVRNFCCRGHLITYVDIPEIAA